MSEWHVNIPFRDRDDPLYEVGLAARELDDEKDRAIVRRLTLDAIEDGLETVGQFLDEFEGLGHRGRRERLDRARSAGGLPTTGEVAEHNENVRWDREWSRLQPPAPEPWSVWQGCPAKGCQARPAGPSGALRPVSVNRWWCPEHRHLAQPGDLEEHEPAYIGLSPTGRPIPSAKEAARIAAEVRKRDEPVERERQQREEHARREGEAIEQAKERYREEGQVSIMGIRCRPDGRVIR